MRAHDDLPCFRESTPAHGASAAERANRRDGFHTTPEEPRIAAQILLNAEPAFLSGVCGHEEVPFAGVQRWYRDEAARE